METFEGYRTLVVERFDGHLAPEKTWYLRLAREDFCQATGTPSGVKDESDGGPGLQKIMDVRLGAQQAGKDRLDFMLTQLVFWTCSPGCSWPRWGQIGPRMTDYQTKAALWLARTPLNAVLAKAHRKLTRYMDLAENWNNGDEQTNGEAWLLQQLGAKLQLVFDVGANVGRWTAMLAQANPRCVVHAFEPSPATFRNLAARFSGNTQVKVWQLGLGDAEGSCRFNDYGENSGLSSFASRRKSVGMEAERIIEVPVRTFDAFCAEEKMGAVDLVKIDTEGYEMAVLRGMQGALQRRAVNLIQFEYGGTWLDAGETLADANDLLLSHGYQLYKLRPASLETVRYDSRRYECFKYANFIAVAGPEVLQRWGLPICPA